MASQHYIYDIIGCVTSCRAVRTQWQKIDFFSCDVVGKKEDGSHVYIQVTAGQDSAVSARKRKLEKEIWHESDTVLLLQLYWEQNPKNKRGKLWYFKVWRYMHDMGKKIWKQHPSEPVPVEWFKLYKKD